MTLTELLQKLERDRFYAECVIKYRAGRVELVRKEETIKLTQGDTHDFQRAK